MGEGEVDSLDSRTGKEGKDVRGRISIKNGPFKEVIRSTEHLVILKTDQNPDFIFGLYHSTKKARPSAKADRSTYRV